MHYHTLRRLASVTVFLASCTPGDHDGALATEVEASYAATSSGVGPAAANSAAMAEAALTDAAGQIIGAARFVQDAQGRVHVTVHAKQLSPGLHGMHLHTIGACYAATTPAFSSAGGHFNPTGRQHGHHNPEGHHSGDLPNLEVSAAGVGRLSVVLDQFQLADLFDTDGTALVIHANEDDLRTDSGPAGPGNSGARIACGVVARM